MENNFDPILSKILKYKLVNILEHTKVHIQLFIIKLNI